MEKIENIKNITQFEDNGTKYTAVIYGTTNDFHKKIFNEKYEEVLETDSMQNNQSENGTVFDINSKETKSFIKAYNKKLNKENKEEKKSIKNDYLPSDFKKLSDEEKEKLFESKGIKEGNVYSVIASNKSENETSVAYYQVYRSPIDGQLKLTPYTSDANFRSNGVFDQKANAENLKGISALALISEEFAENAIAVVYKKNNKIPEENWIKGTIQTSICDITKLVNKSAEDIKKKRLENTKKTRDLALANDEPKIGLETIKHIPDSVSKIFEGKNRKIDEKKYTEKMFLMFKTISSIVPEDRNINSLEKKIFGPLLKNLEKYSNNENEQRKIFSQWVFDNNGNKIMENAGLLFEKSLNKNFKGFEIKRSNFDKKERDENVQAILNNTLPIMQDRENVDYIYNPDNHSVYQGNTQMALQRNNSLSGNNTDTFVESDSMIKNNLSGLSDNQKKGSKLKYEIVELPSQDDERKHYGVLLPVKPTWSERRAERKQEKLEKRKEKDKRNEEYRRNIHDAKYLKKYGSLPEYYTAVQPLPANQPALAAPAQIINPYPFPNKNSTIQDRLNYEFANYFKSMFTKEPFVRGTDWMEKSNKTELLNFAKTKPELFRSMYDACYNQIAVQVRQANRTNEDVSQIVKAITNVEASEHKNEHTHKRGRN